MSAHCQVTGRGPGYGNSVPHSQRRTRIKLRVSAEGIKVIDRDGTEAVVARIRRDGKKI